jgi:hypothetical protein
MRRFAVVGTVVATALIVVMSPGSAAAAIKYSSGSAPLDPGQTAGITAGFCGTNRHHLLSGGVFFSLGGVVANASYPTDGSDGDEEPDDAWFGYVTNTTGIQGTLSVYAVCTTRDVKYRTHETSFGGGDLSTGESCPGRSKATGAGVSVGSAASASTYVRTWAPYDFSFDDRSRMSGVFTAPFPGPAVSVDVTAICSDKLELSYERAKLKIPAADGEQTFVRCPRGSKVVGGGAVNTTVGTGWELATTISIPSDTGRDADTKPDNAWRISINNPSGEERRVPVVAVCAK